MPALLDRAQQRRSEIVALATALPRPPLAPQESPDPAGLSLPPDPWVRDALYKDPILGNIRRPKALRGLISLPGRPGLIDPLREVGVLVVKHQRPIFRLLDDGTLQLLRYDLVMVDYRHNERVDAGAAIQANRMFGTAGTTANGVFTAVAVASAALTKTKTDLSLGSASANVTTNEFTGSGLARATGTVGTYTAPSALGGTFSQVISKLFTFSAGATAKGSGLFDQVVVAASNLFVEDNTTDAVGLSGDTVTYQWTVTS